jgi:hypothetical protein
LESAGNSSIAISERRLFDGHDVYWLSTVVGVPDRETNGEDKRETEDEIHGFA